MSAIETLKLKMADWDRRLSEHSDPYSIGHQLSDLLWRSAFYRSLNESRSHHVRDSQGQPLANGVLHEFIDEGYFAVNAAALRRQLDPGPYSGPKGVNSRYALLRDVSEYASLLTRSNILAAQNLVYDYEPIKALRTREERARDPHALAVCVPSEGWAQSCHWHGTLDRLCGVAPHARSPDDRISETRLKSLLVELGQHGINVKNWVDKFIAHSATHDSKASLPQEHRDVSLARLWLVERVLVRVAGFLSRLTSGHSFGGIAIPSFDQFIHLNQPFATNDANGPMRRAWRQHCADVRRCDQWSWHEPLVDAPETWIESFAAEAGESSADDDV